MEDRVKITVIATGFHSESVGISKKVSDAAAASAAEVRPALQQAAASRHRDEAEQTDTLDSELVSVGTDVDSEDRQELEQSAEAGDDPNDLEVPSFLRRSGESS